MPFVTAFYRALGTGMVISVDSPIDDKVRSAMESLIEDYEHVLSRFRNDSLIAAIGKAEHGGSFDFPDWCAPLFDLYDALFSATSGAIDPCVGEDLIRLGYDASLSFTVTQDAPEHLGALVTHEPVQLDFGACGKGYLVDLLGRMLQSSQFVIDAGGDLLIHAEQPISVALEDPEDQSHAIGIAHIANGALCASAPSRRHWNVAVNERTQIAIHHLLNAIDGLPAQQTEASWAYVPANATLNLARDYPTAVADGLATALFVSDVAQLQRTFDFTYATLDESRQIAVSRNFPADLFLRSA